MATEEITSKLVYEAYYAKPAYMRYGAEWVMSQESFDQVKQLPEAIVSGPGPGSVPHLLGLPVRVKADAVGIRVVPPELPKRITGRKLLEALGDAGIIRVGDFVRRVVIDASIDDSVRVYVERFGDERLLKVATTLAGVEVSGVPVAVEAGDI